MANPTKPICIVIAEDDRATRTIIARMLTSQGFEVREAGMAAEALKAVDNDVQLILVDIGLPDFDGQNLVTRLRRKFTKAKLKICFATSIADTATIKRCLEIGGDDYMIKPIDKSVLQQKVTKLLGKDVPQFAWVGADCAASMHNSAVLPDLRIVRLSEAGLLIRSNCRFQEDAVVALACPTLGLQLGIPLDELVIKVTDCTKIAGSFFVSTEFIGLPEAIAQPIRSMAIRGKVVIDEVAPAPNQVQESA